MDGGTFFGAARGRIGADAADCVAAFAAVADRLGSLRAAVTGIEGQLAALVVFLTRQAEAEDPAARLLIEARALAQAMGDWADPAAGGRVGHRLTTALGRIDRIAREAQMLLAVASLTRVVAAEGADHDFEDYVRSLRDLAATIAEESQNTRGGLAATEVEVTRSRAAMAGAREVIDGLALRLGQSGAAGSALAKQVAEDRSRLQVAASTFPVEAGRETRGLIACMQFSDILSQRLDHAERILGLEGGEGAALAVAQLQAVVADGRAVTETAEAALAALIRSGGAALTVFEAGSGKGAVEALLDRRQAELAQVEAASGAARRAGMLAAEMSAAIEARLGDGLAATQKLDRATYAINLSALNATLLAARGNRSRGAMKVLSDAVRESAALCSESSAACRAALEDCVAACHAGQIEAIRARGEAFGAALDGARAGLASARQDSRELATLEEGAQAALKGLMAAAGAGQAALRRLAEVTASLEATAEELAGACAAEVPPDVAAAAMALYTMEREREVHRACLGAVPVPPRPAVARAVGQVDLDGVLF